MLHQTFTSSRLAISHIPTIWTSTYTTLLMYRIISIVNISVPSRLLLSSTEFCSINMVHSQTWTAGFLQRICSRICPSSPSDNLHLHILRTNPTELWSWSPHQIICIRGSHMIMIIGAISQWNILSVWSLYVEALGCEGPNEVICVIILIDVISWSVTVSTYHRVIYASVPAAYHVR